MAYSQVVITLHIHTYIHTYIRAENLHKYVVNLFNDQYYTEKQAIRTCEIINSIIQ